MKAGQGRVLLDPYKFLPPHGENGVNVSTNGLELRVSIEYDGPDNLPASRTMLFDGAVAFEVASLPGVDMLRIDYSGFKLPLLDGLLEFPDSELAKAWSAHFRILDIKHFQIYFLKANKSIVVFAETFSLVETA